LTQLALIRGGNPSAHKADKRTGRRLPPKEWKARLEAWAETLEPWQREHALQVFSSPPAKEIDREARELLDFFNERRCGAVPGARGFEPKPGMLKFAKARRREGATVGQLRSVVAFIAREVQAGRFSPDYFRPETVWNGVKFWDYLDRMRSRSASK